MGALCGGFVSGLAGFGTGITAIGIWLYAIEPSMAGSLAIICSVLAQSQTMPKIWHTVEAKQVLPFVIPGLIAAPLGTLLLAHIDARMLRLAVGVFLLLFSGLMFLQRPGERHGWGGRWADGVVGFGGGLLGGLIGLSGPLPTLWAGFRGWNKAESRALFQVFNFSILLLALISRAVAGQLNSAVGYAALAAVPGTVLGAWLGGRAYGRLSDVGFKRSILILLCVSGASLVWGNV